MKKVLLIFTLLSLVFPKIMAGDRAEWQMKDAAAKVLNHNVRRAAGNNELKEFKSLPKLKIYGYDEGGFAVVTTDDRFDEVIGYSSSIFGDVIPCGFQWWLETAEEVMEKATDQTIASQLRAGNRAGRSSISPMLTTKWGQENPFNALLNYKIGNNSYTFVTGCVATAMAQVIKYHRCPEKSTGSITYVVSNFMANISHDFGAVYDYDNMLDEYNYQIWGSLDKNAKAVAVLMQDCGMAVKMNYGTKESGASSDEIPVGLINYFSYSDQTKLYNRSDFSNSEWMGMIYNELSLGHPIIYSGEKGSTEGGHAFVLHGYDATTGQVYINWGWKGNYDGYFDINMLNPGKYQYNEKQDMVVVVPGMSPNTGNTKYDLTITASGNGSASYNGTTIRNRTSSFTVNEGSSATISFSPDNGYQIKAVKVNNSTVSVSGNQYTINSVNRNTTVEVEFEATPPTTYTLSVKATGNGYASYSGSTIRNRTSSFTVNEGSSATISFSPDNGYQIKAVKVNNSTVSVSNNQYTISSINRNTTVEVEFEATLPTTYTLSVKAIGNGYASYSGSTIRNRTSSFTVNEGSSATISFSPDNGYRIKAVKVNNSTVSVSNNQYTISSINRNTTVEVEFEATPSTTYTLSVKATGNGYASYSGSTIRNRTSSFTVNEGSSATISFSPDNGYQIKAVKVNNSTVSVSNNRYTISSINRNTTVEVEFEAVSDANNYTITVTSEGNGLVSCSNDQVRNGTKTFKAEEGSSFIVTAVPDEGYRVKFIRYQQTGYIGYKTDYTDKTSVSQSQTVYNIKTDVTFTVEFEKIPDVFPTYTMTVTSEGNGYVSCSNDQVRNGTKTFKAEEGSDFIVTAVPDEGYRVKFIRYQQTGYISQTTDYTDKTSISQSRGVYNIKTDVTFTVEFEKIPNVFPTYTMTVTSEGDHGYVSCSNDQVRNGTKTFKAEEGSDFIVTAVPDEGYRVKFIRYQQTGYISYTNDYSDNASVSQSRGVYNIKTDVAFTIEFEKLENYPVTSYNFSITATGNGTVSYSGKTVRGKTSTFSVGEGSSATLLFKPDDGYMIKSLKVDNTDVTSKISNNSYTIRNFNKNTTVEVVFREIVPTYTLSIKSTGNGSANYNGTTIRNKTNSFTLDKGTSAKISFSPDNGYRIKSVKVNGSTVSLSNNQYTISSINKDTNVDVEFEAITYTLSITSTGNGSASYNGTTIRSKTSSFTVNEGASATITFTPDKGYQIKSVKVNNSAVSVSNNQYTVKNITSNTTVSVEFEVIPPKTYTLSITASGNGSATYNSTTIRSKTSSFTVNEGTSAVISFSPDSGNRIKSVKVNNAAVTVTNNLYMIYTIKEITSNTTVSVEFESTAPSTYTLSITASGNGSVSYSGTTVRSKTSSFTVKAGASATISFTPDKGCRIKAVKVNNTAIAVSNNQYTINNINANTAVSVEFEAITYTLSITALGNGSASYDGTTIRNKTNSFAINEGASATITFSPDNGCHIKSLKVNGASAAVSNNRFKVNSINRNTTVEVEFENNPPSVYKLTYMVDDEVYKVYEVEEGATITPEPDPIKEGYKFSGWSWIPSKMPSEDVVITGYFIQIAYIKDHITYETDGKDASVTHADNVVGEIKIEASVVINGQTYQVTSIAEEAFQGCTGLTSVEIPNTITKIGKDAFSYCFGLQIIMIGKGIKEIGSKAFAYIARDAARTRSDNTGLKVYCEAEVLPSTAADAFDNSPIGGGTLIVNDELVGVYKVVMPWNGFGSIVGLSTGIDSVTIDAEKPYIYDIRGNRIENIRKGVNIILTKDGKPQKVMKK